MDSVGWFTTLIAAVAVERLAELVISRRHVRAARARGGRESGRGHYPVMVGLHIGLLAGCLVEVWGLDRPFVAWVGWPMFALVVGAQALRWWCIRTLGPQWSTRVIVVPGERLVSSGPYRWVRHPNYLAVVVEGLALPLVHDAWLTAAVFTAVNLPLLAMRIRCEDRALGRSRWRDRATTSSPASV